MTSKLTQPVVPGYKGSLEEDGVLVEGDGVPLGPVAVVEVAALLQHGAGVAQPAVVLETKVIRMFPKISQSRRRPLLGPSPG